MRAREAARPGSQGTTAVRGTWCSEGDAGRHLRTMAGPGPGTPSPAPVPLRLERIATQAREYPKMAFTTLCPPSFGMWPCWNAPLSALNPHSAPRGGPGDVAQVQGAPDKQPGDFTRETRQRHVLSATRRSPGSSPSHGKLRPLGLPALEDKIVAKAVAMLLEAIYEQDFYDFSHGFRPGRSRIRPCTKYGRELLGSRIG